MAMNDDIIPLEKPILLRNGETVSEVKIRKGQYVSQSSAIRLSYVNH